MDKSQIIKIGMPKSAESAYKLWIGHCPESLSPTDMNLFYFFVAILISSSRRERNRAWLREVISADCKRLTPENIECYCDVYEHIRLFKSAHKSQTAMLIGQDFVEKQKEKYRKNVLDM